jgi:hypothetical protein
MAITVPPSAEELELQRMQLDLARQEQGLQKTMFPYLMDQMGYKFNQDTGYMEKKSLEGTVSPGLEKGLARQENVTREGLSRQLGSGYETSTPGIQSITSLRESQEMQREESRRGNLAIQSDIQQRGYNQLQGLSGPGTQLIGALSGPIQSYQAQRGLLANENMFYAQQKQQEQSALYGAIGQGIGMIGYGLLS